MSDNATQIVTAAAFHDHVDPDFYEELLDYLHDGVYYVNNDLNITLWNKSAQKITGYSKEEVVGCKCSDNILRHMDDDGQELCLIGCPLKQTIKDGQIREADVFLHHKDGHRVPISVRVTPIYDKSKKVIGAVEIFSDNSKNIYLLQELEALKNETYTDALTQIGNRKYLEFMIDKRLKEITRYQLEFGILFFDIDHFKKVNDTHGHPAGDQALRLVSKTVFNIIRSIDTICRWGGDEFVVILPNVDPIILEKIAEKISKFVQKTWMTVDDELIHMTLSIGGTMAKKEDDIDSLIKRADEQMYHCKDKGRNTISIG